MRGGFAVVDVETTGFLAGRNDRIVEIAVVELDHTGETVREWCTLVNPKRDLGPQQIHLISSAEILDAPTFADIAGDVAEHLAGSVLVAHNLAFDSRFLDAEFGRFGSAPALTAAPGLCTMRLSSQFLTTSRRTLESCCAAAGVPLTNAHSALHDARAAAGLLRYFRTASRQSRPWPELIGQAESWRWPVLPAPSGRVTTRHETRQQPVHFLARLVDQLPRVTDPPEADSYLAVLDNALLDRHLSVSEQNELVEVATELGLSRADVVPLHRSYLLALARAAWADHVVTDDERADLRLVARLLGLDRSEVERALADGRSPATEPAVRAGGFQLRAGDPVVFTGATKQPREAWETQARSVGLVVGGGVTKKTRLVVAADPDSLSGKAAKARTYRIPIVTEDAFATLINSLRKVPR
ncbi:MAG TPA: exonuclease domain-containing protein [Pseudonocardiaceae bacterium]|jgi:DNA polymerase-3 subunit epsilon|nr:exonuclease domain-containing protein [Pseudonocardiaceae bacterium]